MADEFEVVELEYSEDDIVYYIFDEDDNEIGFAIMEDGKEVEYYYEGFDAEDYELVESDDFEGEDVLFEEADDVLFEDAGEDEPVFVELSELDGEVVEMEIDEDAIEHYLVDEEGNEIGFVIIEDGVEIECYYQEEDEEPSEFDLVAADVDDVDDVDDAQPAIDADDESEPVEHGYLYKLAQIAGHTGNKARKKAGKELGKARDKAMPELEKARDKAGAGLSKVRASAEAGVDKATEAVEEGGKKLKSKSDEYDIGITREGVAEATADLNVIAKEGAQTAKELKEAYDDIMDSFGVFVPKKIRRRLP